MCRFLPAPSARRATEHTVVLVCSCVISIHALREEGDQLPPPHPGRTKYFYPRPPRGGRPRSRPQECHADQISIHALREEGDPGFRLRIFSGTNFYPRPPRGGRLTVRSIAPGRSQFLSTPSARRATAALALPRRLVRVFLSTPSARRATARATSTQHPQVHFYPRPPRGGRPVRFLLLHVQQDFYPRPPRGGRRGCTSGRRA